MDPESNRLLREVMERIFKQSSDYSRCTNCLARHPTVELDAHGECWRCGYLRLGEPQE